MKQENTTTEYIDVTPTWETAATMLAHVMRDGTAEGQRQAAQGIIDMGRIIDGLQARIRLMKRGQS